jgi:hypothetical protein
MEFSGVTAAPNSSWGSSSFTPSATAYTSKHTLNKRKWGFFLSSRKGGKIIGIYKEYNFRGSHEKESKGSV